MNHYNGKDRRPRVLTRRQLKDLFAMPFPLRQDVGNSPFPRFDDMAGFGIVVRTRFDTHNTRALCDATIKTHDSSIWSSTVAVEVDGIRIHGVHCTVLDTWLDMVFNIGSRKLLTD